MSESGSDDQEVRAKHATYSVLRERIVEHAFIAEVMRLLWLRDVMDIEVLRAEFDTSGYDLVMSSASVLRHIQLKVSLYDGARSRVNINLKLGKCPSGCVLWIVVDHDLKAIEYRWFGGPPGEPLPDIEDRGVVRHTRANALGLKAVRDGQRSLSQSEFRSLDGLEAVIEQLFGIERPKS
ncbi:hypothetical protein [Burkholderia sp. AU15512]|uniref:hypothetical protein n=1 Tax=Burkholderia sp. AU15512 TaxID=2015345 RepID=UPI000B79CECF|nr:hypothetical protein [Burkholderia sp. AU15512]OXI22512.1 hypothetical protein CFB43_17435 [Burkholderia sp. AU15512]